MQLLVSFLIGSLVGAIAMSHYIESRRKSTRGSLTPIGDQLAREMRITLSGLKD